MTNVEMAIMARFNLTEKEIIRMKKFKTRKDHYANLLTWYSDELIFMLKGYEWYKGIITTTVDQRIEFYETLLTELFRKIENGEVEVLNTKQEAVDYKVEQVYGVKEEDDNLYTYNSYGELVAQVLGMELACQIVVRSRVGVCLRGKDNDKIYTFEGNLDESIKKELNAMPRTSNYYKPTVSGKTSFKKLFALYLKRTTYKGLLPENNKKLLDFF